MIVFLLGEMERSCLFSMMFSGLFYSYQLSAFFANDRIAIDCRVADTELLYV